MHTIINALSPARRSRSPEPALTGGFRQPNYDCRDHPDAVKLVVYVPGVDAAGVEIEARGTDLAITARKAHFVRVNWQSLHLEGRSATTSCGSASGRPRLRGDAGGDPPGVLTLTLPKRPAHEAGAGSRLRHVA